LPVLDLLLYLKIEERGEKRRGNRREKGERRNELGERGKKKGAMPPLVRPKTNSYQRNNLHHPPLVAVYLYLLVFQLPFGFIIIDYMGKRRIRI
jgi:hypothetical protein